MIWEEGSKAFDFLNAILDSFKQLKSGFWAKMQEN